MSKPGIKVPREDIAKFCKRNQIRKLSLFGSVLRADFSDYSDVDILIEFESGKVKGMLEMAGLEIELSDILGRKVDLRTPAELSRYFRNEVVMNSAVQYVRG